jgi:hypothetical protein
VTPRKPGSPAPRRTGTEHHLAIRLLGLTILRLLHSGLGLLVRRLTIHVARLVLGLFRLWRRRRLGALRMLLLRRRRYIIVLLLWRRWRRCLPLRRHLYRLLLGRLRVIAPGVVVVRRVAAVWPRRVCRGVLLTPQAARRHISRRRKRPAPRVHLRPPPGRKERHAVVRLVRVHEVQNFVAFLASPPPTLLPSSQSRRQPRRAASTGSDGSDRRACGIGARRALARAWARSGLASSATWQWMVALVSSHTSHLLPFIATVCAACGPRRCTHSPPPRNARRCRRAPARAPGPCGPR